MFELLKQFAALFALAGSFISAGVPMSGGPAAPVAPAADPAAAAPAVPGAPGGPVGLPSVSTPPTQQASILTAPRKAAPPRQPAPTTAPTTTTVSPPAPPKPAPVTPPASPGGGGSSDGIAKALFDDINSERSARGLAPLSWDAQLANLGAQWSKNMSSKGSLSHRNTGSDFAGVSPAAATSGENVYMGRGSIIAGAVHGAWMNSAGHRRNILQPGFDRVGIGVYCAPDGSLWATQEFAGSEGKTLDSTTPGPGVSASTSDGPSCSG